MDSTLIQLAGAQDPGVLYFVKSGEDFYFVKVRWKDGKETEVNFPVKGFDVIDPVTGQSLGFIKGNKSIQILKDHAGEFTSEEEFPWKNFLHEKFFPW